MELEIKKMLEEKKEENRKCQVRITELESENQTLKHEDIKNKEKNDSLMKNIRKYKNKIKEKVNVEMKYLNEKEMRKKIQNDFIDYRGKIRVYWRIRPLSRLELENQEQETIKAVNDFSISVSDSKMESYDGVFGPNSSQNEVFEETKMLVQSSIDGYNVCILAYGATGSGKTHTIIGNEENPGICPRAISELFNKINSLEKDKYQTRVSCTMIELYCDEMNDLLYWKYKEENKEAEESKLSIHTHPKTKNFYIKGWVSQTLDNEEEACRTYKEGIESRRTAKTNYNAYSSRSHLIFTLIIDIYDRKRKIQTQGKLTLVDLAGSEKLKHEENSIRKKEGISVNSSLSALNNVIFNLSNKGGSSHIPYRDNKLTQVLQDSLGGNSKTLIMVNINPSNIMFDQSNNSILWASKLKNIEVPKSIGRGGDRQNAEQREENAALRSQVEDLQRLLIETQGKLNQTSKEISYY